MKIYCLRMTALLLLMMTCGAGAEALSELQVWTAKDGRTVQAKFVKLEGDVVRVDKDGKSFAIPLAKLSTASAELARKMAAQAGGTTQKIGEQIVAFCKENLTKKVGDGECSALAGKALTVSGAAPMGRDAPGKGDYVWGEQVAMIEFVEKKVQGLETLAQVQPGDIIQFRDMQLKGDVVTAKGRGWYSLSAPHHTAVVNSVDAAKNTLAIFHQNWSGNKTVRQDTLKLSDLVSGWLRIYRPKPLP